MEGLGCLEGRDIPYYKISREHSGSCEAQSKGISEHEIHAGLIAL